MSVKQEQILQKWLAFTKDDRITLDLVSTAPGDAITLAYYALELKERVDFLIKACAKQDDEITQTLGKALGYPWYKDDQANFPGATEADGVCVGAHVAGSLAMEAASRILSLEKKVENCHD